MHEPSLHGVSWVLSCLLMVAGCSSNRAIYPSRVPGVVERADNMSREEALQILKRNVEKGSPLYTMVEQDGIRQPEVKDIEPRWKQVSEPDERGYAWFQYKRHTWLQARFLAFNEIHRLERTEHWTRKHWTEDKYEWIMMRVDAGPNYRLPLSVNGEHQALDLEFTDVLAAFYKLCPSLRRGPGDSDVGGAAARQLSDQTLLTKIAVKDKDALVRAAATRKLTDQILLAKIAVRDKDALVRAAAVRKVTDPTLLAKIAVEDKDALVRGAAAETFGDPTLLAKIAAEADAAKQRADQIRLAKIAVEDDYPAVRAAAVRKLTDQTVLAKIAVKDWDPIVREEAVRKLTDQTLLAKIAVKDMDAVVRAAAAKQLAAQKEMGQSQGQTENQVQEK